MSPMLDACALAASKGCHWGLLAGRVAVLAGARLADPLAEVEVRHLLAVVVEVLAVQRLQFFSMRFNS